MRLEPPRWWYDDTMPRAAWALWPVARAYGGIAERRFRKATPYRSALPVICVGNFTMGGAGKTPVALKLAGLLRGQGRQPAFLTRGFGGSERGPYLIDSKADDAGRVGDEPLLLARAAPTVVSRDRPAGARFIEASAAPKPDVIVMDDGFQNPTLAKDFCLVVVDGGAGIGNGRVFPLGPLRAPLDAQLSRADAVVILGGADAPSFAGEDKLKRSGLPLWRAEIVPTVEAVLRERPVLAFCGIGRPAKFFDTLRAVGVAVAGARAFPDHHPYSDADAQALLAEARSLGAHLVTTEKDRARLRGGAGALSELYETAAALPIGVRFAADDEAALLAALAERHRPRAA